MPRTATLERTDFRVHDEINLPPDDGGIVEGRATRSDAYAIFVTDSLPETVARLRHIAGDAQLAVITEEVVYALHGDALVAALREAGVRTEVNALHPGERSKSIERAVKLWD